MARGLPALSRAERIEVVNAAIAEGRYAPSPRAAAPAQLGASQLQRVSDFLRRHETEKGLTSRDVRGHGATAEHPGQPVKITPRGRNYVEQTKVGSRRGYHPEGRDVAKAIKAHFGRRTTPQKLRREGKEITLRVEGRASYPGEKDRNRVLSVRTPAADLLEDLEELDDDELLDYVNDLFGGGGPDAPTFDSVLSVTVAESR